MLFLKNGKIIGALNKIYEYSLCLLTVSLFRFSEFIFNIYNKNNIRILR